MSNKTKQVTYTWRKALLSKWIKAESSSEENNSTFKYRIIPSSGVDTNESTNVHNRLFELGKEWVLGDNTEYGLYGWRDWTQGVAYSRFLSTRLVLKIVISFLNTIMVSNAILDQAVWRMQLLLFLWMPYLPWCSPRRLRTFATSLLPPEERMLLVNSVVCRCDRVVIKIKKNANGETKFKVRCSKVGDLWHRGV